MRWNSDDELMSYPSDMSQAQKTKTQKNQKNRNHKKSAQVRHYLDERRSSGIGGTEDIDLLGRELIMDVTSAVVSSD
jgi:hypothetical protein